MVTCKVPATQFAFGAPNRCRGTSDARPGLLLLSTSLQKTSLRGRGIFGHSADSAVSDLSASHDKLQRRSVAFILPATRRSGSWSVRKNPATTTFVAKASSRRIMFLDRGCLFPGLVGNQTAFRGEHPAVDKQGLMNMGSTS